MYQRSGIYAIVVLLNLLHLRNANAELKSINQTFSYPQKRILINKYAMEEGIFVYAVCEENRPPTENTCTIYQRRFPYDQVAHSCNVTLRVKHPNNVYLTDRVWVLAFGLENAILLWEEMGTRNIFNLMTIQLNSCKKSVLEFNDDNNMSIYYGQTYEHRFVTYDDYFDIFIGGTKPQNQSSANQFGMRIYLDREPQPIYNIIKDGKVDDVGYIFPIATRSPNKGYVHTTGKSIALIKPDGTEKVLIIPGSRRISISVNNDIISLCAVSKTDSLQTCTQYNENGEEKLKITLDHDVESETAVVHTTPAGGFLLMTVTFERPFERIHYNTIKSVDVVRFDSKGRNLGSVRLNIIYASPYLINVWENGDEYCITSASDSYREPLMQISTNCFAENDFTS